MINKKRKPDTKAKATEEKTPEATLPVETSPEPVQEEKATQPAEEVTLVPVPTPASIMNVEPLVAAEIPAQPSKPKSLTMANLKLEVDELRTLVQTLTTQMADVQSQLSLKRKPTVNNKVQIKDTVTGKIYKSKNNVYQTMLKAGELKELVEKNTFGPSPEKNTFGVYALFRAYPDRFEEIHDQEQTPQ